MDCSVDHVLGIAYPKVVRNRAALVTIPPRNTQSDMALAMKQKRRPTLTNPWSAQMPSRRKPSPTKSALPATGRSRHDLRPGKKRRPSVSKNRAARRWRRDTRPRIIRTVVSATKALKWSTSLIEAVLEELYVDDHFEELLERAPGDLRPSQSAQAIAVALILRHSWQPDDLACMLNRLRLHIDDA